MANDDYFSDVDAAEFGLGVLDGEGGKEHKKSRHKVTPEGVQCEMTCDICGAQQYITPSWDEMIFVMEKRLPPGAGASPPWAYDGRRGMVYPQIPCIKCGRHDTRIGFTPDEAKKHLNAATQAGYVPEAYIAQALVQLRGRPR